MNERISALTELTLAGKLYAHPVKTEFAPEEPGMSQQLVEASRLCQFIRNQEPALTEYSRMTGFFNCDGSVVGDGFRRMGHKNTGRILNQFYCKSVENLSTLEWQHATADYRKVLEKGLSGILREIGESLTAHSAPEERDFLLALREVALTLMAWARKCAQKAAALGQSLTDPAHRENLLLLARTLERVPENPPETFYEAVLTIYFCFAADPDSVGTLDRYLEPFYEADLRKGILTREEAKETLQELFLMIQAATQVTSHNFTRGGESHFCVGGYLPDGSDGFTDLSRLILESLTELPTYIPQVTLRWTAKTPREVFRYTMDLERKDPHKRIAFQNDEKRIQCYTRICGFPFEKAVGYTTVGCNEPAFPGTVSGGTTHVNFLRCVERLFHTDDERLFAAADFEAFYRLFLEYLHNDLSTALAYDDAYNRERAKDINYLSSLFFHGCIEKARSMTQGPADTVIASPTYMGIPNAIDSLIIVQQFVYDEKLVTMEELTQALRANWQGWEDLQLLIKKKGDFFGNDTPRSNAMAQRLYRSLHEFLKDKTNLFGYHWLIGDLIGYNPHHKWFGEQTKATPDGRAAGEHLTFGLGQTGGKDRSGLTALLNAVAGADPTGIGCGSTVTNLMIDEKLVLDDAHFEKTVDMLETYFRNGGVHFQLTYVSREDLLRARETPEKYKHLRVRVSGFSDYFVKLEDSLQQDIIRRTTQG